MTEDKTFLVLKNISKSYEAKIIFDGLNISFPKKGLYVIRGDNGVGKTTFLNLIAKYEIQDEGRIEYNFEGNIGYLFQQDLLFSNLTVEENIYIKKEAIQKDNNTSEAMKLATYMGITDKFNERVSNLSGGERKCLEICLLLLDDPDVILMDEPTVNLDYQNRTKIENAISLLSEKKLVLVVTHDKTISLTGYKTIYMEKGGRVIEKQN